MYFKAYIDETGFHYPTYADIRDYLCDKAKEIFGQDIYLENDSADYQYICAFAEKAYDCFQANELTFLNRGPSSAVGIGLDDIIKLNGIERKDEKYSEVPVKLTGIAGNSIKGGKVVDKSGIVWQIPDCSFVNTSIINTIATCTVSGPIIANVGDINQIYTPQYGWTSVTNESSNSYIGRYQETDAELRIRQTKSTAMPSLSLFEGMDAAIGNIDNVTRWKSYENSTDTADENGIPAHSVAVIVEGGSPEDIGNAIYTHKSPGCGTYGTSSVVVEDNKGGTHLIKYSQNTYLDIDVSIELKPLDGYTTVVANSIKTNIENYLNNLKIGTNISWSSLWGIALKAMSDFDSPNFSITSLTVCIHGETLGTSDITIPYNKSSRGNTDYITITEV